MITKPRSIIEQTFRTEELAIAARREARELNLPTSAIDYDEERELFSFEIWQSRELVEQMSIDAKIAQLATDYNLLASSRSFEPSEKFAELTRLEAKRQELTTRRDAHELDGFETLTYPRSDLARAIVWKCACGAMGKIEDGQRGVTFARARSAHRRHQSSAIAKS